jgi:glucose-1-phosphate thymidylyltransferase
VERLRRGMAWLDTSTQESLLQAGNFMEAIEQRQGRKIGCLEEIALDLGYVDKRQILASAMALENSEYGKYLIRVAAEDRSTFADG